ncbi:hypothetical protein [Streptomyces sp. NPDC049590]|uniref:hypothetical protein n=1 Tax=Streptomyces sp. NPDC049590 TaxID=3154834 RepID=UPI00343C5D9D
MRTPSGAMAGTRSALGVVLEGRRRDPGDHPHASGCTHGWALLALLRLAATGAALLVPARRPGLTAETPGTPAATRAPAQVR